MRDATDIVFEAELLRRREVLAALCGPMGRTHVAPAHPALRLSRNGFTYDARVFRQTPHGLAPAHDLGRRR